MKQELSASPRLCVENKPARLLVIEDELPMRTALADALAAEGYRVLTAADGPGQGD